MTLLTAQLLKTSTVRYPLTPQHFLVPFVILFCVSMGIASDRPNIILVMCDDLGYGDLRSFNEASPIDTPNLSAMAMKGLKFERFYSAGPVCSPTRGSCLTGRHPYRYGIYSANVGHLKREEVTLPELLKTRGYITGHFGKWHLGTLTKTIKDANRGGPGGVEDFSPPSWHGYDESFVTESKVPIYDPMIKPINANRKAWDALDVDSDSESYGTHYWDHQGNAVTDNLDGDDSRIIMDRAVEFIQRSVKSREPFFAAIWFHAPHLPVVADQSHTRPYQQFDEYKRNYFGCISAMDDQMGRLRKQLRDMGIANQTILWFCSDNGPEGQTGKAPGSAGNFRGRKRSLYEGGVRVPAILEWPGSVEPGVTNAASVTSDFLPTIAQLLEIDIPTDRPIDGVSLVPVILGRTNKRYKPLGFQSAKQIAWHAGDLKAYSPDQGKTWELYDLASDPAESNNLAKEQPTKLNELIRQASAWQASCKKSDQGMDY